MRELMLCACISLRMPHSFKRHVITINKIYYIIYFIMHLKGTKVLLHWGEKSGLVLMHFFKSAISIDTSSR